MFSDPNLMLVGLARFELPGKTVRLCDGGFVYFEGQKHTSADEDFGSIQEVAPFEDMAGDQAPGATMTFLPRSSAAAADLSQPSFQGSPMKFWVAQVDQQTGTIVHAELVASMELDTTTLRISRGQRVLDIGMIAASERLFLINEGNVLSPNFHKTIWPGELGFDNAIGVPMTKAWGAAAPPRGTTAVGGFVGGMLGIFGSGGGGGWQNNVHHA